MITFRALLFWTQKAKIHKMKDKEYKDKNIKIQFLERLRRGRRGQSTGPQEFSDQRERRRPHRKRIPEMFTTCLLWARRCAGHTGHGTNTKAGPAWEPPWGWVARMWRTRSGRKQSSGDLR